MLNHPIAFAAAALFAVGFVIYQLFKEEERPYSQRGSGKPPPPGPSPGPRPGPPPIPPLNPKSKNPPNPASKTSSNPALKTPSNPAPKPSSNSSSKPPSPPKSEPSPTSILPSPSTNSTDAQNSTNYSESSEDRGNCLRRRKCSPKTTDSDSSRAAECDTKEKSASNFCQDGEQNKLSNVYYDNIDVKNYKMNVVDKLKEEVTPINIEPEKTASLDGNLMDADSDTNSDSDNDIFEKSKTESSIRSVSDASASELRIDETELIYKKNVLDKLKNDVKNLNQNVHCKEEGQHKNMRRDEVASSSSGPSPSSGRFVVSLNANNNTSIMDRKVCKACEEKPCEAVAYPCGHCNLCSECAERFFRLYKKCNFCLSDIEGYHL